jgi:hypothetical protein
MFDRFTRLWYTFNTIIEASPIAFQPPLSQYNSQMRIGGATTVTDDTMFSLDSKIASSPPVNHRALMRLPLFGANPANIAAMRDLEIVVAKRLLSWLLAQPHCAHYAETLKALTDDTSPLHEDAQRLTYALWDETHAARWIAPRDARRPRDFLWQFACVRLARYLASGTWEAV